MGRTEPLTSERCVLYIYSTNIGTEYFKHALYSLFFSLQNAVCFIMLTCLVPVLFTFYIQCVLKLKKNNSGGKGLRQQDDVAQIRVISCYVNLSISSPNNFIPSSHCLGCQVGPRVRGRWLDSFENKITCPLLAVDFQSLVCLDVSLPTVPAGLFSSLLGCR